MIPLYERKSLLLGTYLAIYPNKVIYQEARLKPQIVIPANQIASVITSTMLAKVTLVTTGNKKVKMQLPSVRDKQTVSELLERIAIETIPAL